MKRLAEFEQLANVCILARGSLTLPFHTKPLIKAPKCTVYDTQMGKKPLPSHQVLLSRKLYVSLDWNSLGGAPCVVRDNYLAGSRYNSRGACAETTSAPAPSNHKTVNPWKNVMTGRMVGPSYWTNINSQCIPRAKTYKIHLKHLKAHGWRQRECTNIWHIK